MPQLALTPTQKRHFREALAEYGDRAERARLTRNYTQQRYYTGLALAPDHAQDDDCSAYTAKASYWAMHESGVFVPDPLNYSYRGLGNTGTSYLYVKGHAAPTGKYLVGDLAFFSHGGGTAISHMSWCKKAGTAKTSVFSSHGHQSWIFGLDAPEPISLADESVRQHLVGVFRPPALL